MSGHHPFSSSKPVGSTGGGRHAPAMQPDDEPPSREHYCPAVDDVVACPIENCPITDHDDGEVDDA